MTSIVFDTLENTSMDKIHEAFVDAFSHYTVPFNLSEDQLRYMIERRGYEAKLSFGAFHKGRLVGFVLNGYGIWKGKSTAYDTGTGIIQDYQGKGISGKLLDATILGLRKQNVEQYLLEVIRTNDKAVGLYKSRGFGITREFDYYNFTKQDISSLKNDSHYVFEVKNITSFDFLTTAPDINHSWQNSDDSILRKKDHMHVIKVYDKSILIGYSIVELHTGDISQLWVHAEYRRKGIGAALLNRSMQLSVSEKMKVINVENGYMPFKAFFERIGIGAGLGQYEMVKNL